MDTFRNSVSPAQIEALGTAFGADVEAGLLSKEDLLGYGLFEE